MQKERYEIAPQMRVYDRLPMVLHPYLAFVPYPNFRSEVVNTDDYGFRISDSPQGAVDTHFWWSRERRGIVLGGSFTFGVGATHDSNTVVSVLNRLGDYCFLNLGIRAGNSTQEVLAAVPFLDWCRCVVFCTGVNNVVVAIQSLGRYELWGPLFAEEVFETLSSLPVEDIVSRVNRSFDAGARSWLRGLYRGLYQKLGRKGGSRDSGSEVELSRFRDPAAQALRRQVRDLTMIVRCVPARCQVIFAAQPLAGAVPRSESSEEKRLFAITDELQSRHWHILKSRLLGLWSEYVIELKDACERLGIQFINLGEPALDGWAYVDRAHLTDNGYRQVAERLVGGLQ